MKTATPTDLAGMTLSMLCIMHCLVLPILSTTLPILSILSGFEWLHKGLVILAMPVAMGLIATTQEIQIRVLALTGAILLFSAAFIKQAHDFELVITVIGALLLCGAHLCRLLKNTHSH